MEKKKMLSILLLCIIFAGVLMYALSTDATIYPGNIYNNEDLILKGKDHYNAENALRTPFNEEGQTKVSFESFSGLNTLFDFQIGDESDSDFDYSWNSRVESGQFKVVLLNVGQQEIAELMCEGTGSGAKELQLAPGKYSIKAIGDSAKVDLDLTLNALRRH